MGMVRMTVKDIMNLGLWDKVCEYKNWNPYIIREGRIDDDEMVEFDSEFKKKVSSGEYEYTIINSNGDTRIIVSMDILRENQIIEIDKKLYVIESIETNFGLDVLSLSRLDVTKVKSI